MAGLRKSSVTGSRESSTVPCSARRDSNLKASLRFPGRRSSARPWSAAGARIDNDRPVVPRWASRNSTGRSTMQGVGVGRRAVAIIIDMIVLGIIGWVLALGMGGATSDGFNLSGAPAFIWFLIALAYYVVMEVQMGGSLGKLALGLRVVKEGGEKLDWQAAIIRNNPL